MGRETSRRRIYAIVALLVTAILVVAAYYVLVVQNPYNNRPIKASPDEIVLTVADLPNGWTVNSTVSLSFNNATDGGDEGWNWTVQSRFINSSSGEIRNLWIYVCSFNSSGLANEAYVRWSDLISDFPHIPLQLGDEGFMFTLSGSVNGADSVNYHFREGNVMVLMTIDMDGENIYSISAWMNEIASLQAAKLHKNNPS